MPFFFYGFIMIFFFFPMPIRVVAIILILWAVFGIITGENAGGQAAHLGGMVAGAIYVLSHSWRANIKLKIQSAHWQRRVANKHNLQVEVDRILQKVHDRGIHSLTAKEKKVLKQASRNQQMKNGL